jgi:FAD/FMN-containing dehydrogenase
MSVQPNPAPDAASLASRITSSLPAGTAYQPGTAPYAASTTPDNSSFGQHPVAVVRPRTAADVAAAVALARELGLRVVVQATGHGSAAALGDGLLLVDTSALDAVSVSPAGRTVRVGAGVTWAEVQAQAEPHRLLALSGTSPTVGVSGYTFNGGVGWLVRPFGLASAALRAVEYVDGAGHVHRASDDSTDPTEREALWAFRGGAPAGLATELEFDLFPVSELWAGYLLWPAGRLPALAAAWTGALAAAPDTLTSTLSLLHLPPGGPFPKALLNTTVVHLSYASAGGERDLTSMRSAMRAVAEPAVDTTGQSDAARLSGIHLDPPPGVPARGTGRWLGPLTADAVSAIFGAARVGQPDGLNMIELRHVDAPAGKRGPGRDGALIRVPGPFLLHAVGAADSDQRRADVDTYLGRVEEAARPADLGRAAPSFREGQPGPADAYTEPELRRLTALAAKTDPDRIFAFQRGPRSAAVAPGD